MELTRALTAVENARMEWNSARLKIPALDGETAKKNRGRTAPHATLHSPLANLSFGQLCKIGLALTWPLLVVALGALGVFIAILVAPIEDCLMARQKKTRSHFRPRPRAQRPDRRARSRDQKTRLSNPAHARAEIAFHRHAARRNCSARSRKTAPRRARAHEPVFEEVRTKCIPGPKAEPPDHYNELGVRKYDLPALWNRLRNHFRRPTTNNPRLVNYLAAGGVHGLRPMRYEKRVARNRFILLVVVLFLILLGVISVFMRIIELVNR